MVKRAAGGLICAPKGGKIQLLHSGSGKASLKATTKGFPGYSAILIKARLTASSASSA